MIPSIVDWISSLGMGEWAFVPFRSILTDGTVMLSCPSYSDLIDSPINGQPICIGD